MKVKILMPDNIKFSDLKLCRDPDGMVSFDKSVIERICETSHIDPNFFLESHEDNVSVLIVEWYLQHRNDGGEPDSVAEDLIAETIAEDKLGGGISYPPGRA